VDIGQPRPLQASPDYDGAIGMNRSARATASLLGIYAGVLGIEHGVFEMLQGNTAPDGLLTNAIGPPCDPDAVWHSCFPAIALIPNLAVTGIVAIAIGLAVLTWAAASVQRKHGGLVLVLLSGGMSLAGGGFVPAFAGIIAGVAGTRIGAPLTWWQARSSAGPVRLLARLWPWPLVVLLAWLPGGWILGHFFNQALMSLGVALFLLLDLGLPILAVFSGLARDVQRTSADAAASE
jgi:hypothetical protein